MTKKFKLCTPNGTKEKKQDLIMHKTNNTKRAIIVGATSGIGKEVAILLEKKGWKVGIAGRRFEPLSELRHEHAGIEEIEVIDITKPDAPQLLLKLIEKLGGIDLYFHSSGIGYQNPSLDMEKECATVHTNAYGFTQMIITAFNHFLSHPEKKCHLAAISSIAGTKGLGAAPAYSSTKRYINHYLQCLRQLCSIRRISHIRIHDIRPGFVKTPLLTDGGRYPMQLDVKDVAEKIVKGIENNKSVITIDWKYRILVAFWRLIPNFIWVNLRISSK